MDTTEQRAAWFRFINKRYGRIPTIQGPLQHATILKSENGCEIRIPVSSTEKEEFLNKFAGDFGNLLREAGSEYAALLPVSFSFLRNDGTVVPIVSRSPRYRFPPEMLMSREERLRKEQQEFREKVKHQTDIFYCNISNAVNYADVPPEDIQKCKDSFDLILKEYSKAGEEEPTFKCADRFISAIKEPIDNIENKIGTSSDYFMYAYNMIVNRYLDIVFQSIRVSPSLSGLEVAKNRIEQFSQVALTELTRERLKRDKIVLQLLGQSEEYKQRAKKAEKSSRLSERIKNYALEHSSISSGGERYTSPGWAWLMLLVLGFGSIVSFFEWIASPFTNNR